MKHRRRNRRGGSMVNASELAQMGRCEQLVIFEHRYGQRRLPHQAVARRRGLDEHRRFEREGASARALGSRHVGRCFIASLLFGEAWQSQVLRQFRDIVLRPRGWGRALMRLYYRAAPAVCSVLQRWPLLQRPVRWVLGLVANAARWHLDRSPSP